MKLSKIIYLTLTLSLAAIKSYGQFNTPVRTTMSTPYGNVSSTYYVPSPRYYYGQSGINLKYDFTIVMKNDSTFTTKTKMDISDKGNQFLTLKRNQDKIEIKPAETKSIMVINYAGHKLVGIPVDTCWLFKVAMGKINSYSFVPIEDVNMATAIQEEKGPIVPLNKESLRSIMSCEPRLLKMIEKGKFIKAIIAYNQIPYSELKR